MSAATVNLVVAMGCEAAPLLRGLALKSLPVEGGFRAWCDDARETFLLQAGIGRVNAAAGVVTLQALSGHPACSAWLNVGIAGHAEEEIGRVLVAESVHEEAGGRGRYPALPAGLALGTAPLLTVDRPSSEYRPGFLHDMEGSAFMATALRYSSTELVHCLKVVSDNRAQPLSTAGLSKTRVESLLELAVEDVVSMVAELRVPAEQRASRLAPPAEWQKLSEEYACSVTQAALLRRLLQRWNALFPGRELPEVKQPASARGTAAGELLRQLEAGLDEMWQRDGQ